MATPTLTMIPSGYKAEKVYSVLPTNGDGDFTFNRNNTATRVNKNGLIEQVATDIPRLDYSNGSCPSLLLEPSSLNLALYSQDFSQSDWTVFDVSKSANSVISPDGTLNASKLTALSGTNKAFQQLVTVSADPSNNRVYSGSIYVKSSSVTSCSLRVGSATSNNAITITNEWQRFEAQYTLAATFTAVRLGIVLNNEGDEVDVAFGQVEEKPFATSYIPTTTNTQSRSADSAFKTGLSSYINDSEGVLYAEISALGDDLTFRNISLSDSSLINRIYIRYSNVSNIIQAIVEISGVYQVVITQVVSDITLNSKVAFRYKANDFSLFINGTKYIGTPLNGGSVPSGLNRLGFDYGIAGADFYGKTKDVRVYKSALTDAELITLTTI